MPTAGSLIESYLPVFFRLLPLLVLVPVAGLDRLPATVRVFFCLTLTVCLTPAMNTLATDVAPVSIANLLAQGLLGTALALGIHACLAGLHTGASLIDTQAGSTTAGIFNATHGGSGVFTEFLILAITVTALLSDSVMYLLATALAVAPTAFDPGDPTSLSLLVKSFARQFAAGFLITFPMIAGLWLVDVLAAASSRLLPQANVYFLFLPAKALFATLLFATGSATLLAAADRLLRVALTG